MRPAISYVESHYHGEVRNEIVAELCDMNQFRFSRQFKQTYGIGFHEFVVRYRLREARRMLANPGSSITQICYAAGFNDPSYFTRVFKKYFGGNPSEFLGVPLNERFDADGSYEASGPIEKTDRRMFVKRLNEFDARWPDHPEAAWVRRQRGRFEGMVDLSEPPRQVHDLPLVANIPACNPLKP